LTNNLDRLETSRTSVPIKENLADETGSRDRSERIIEKEKG